MNKIGPIGVFDSGYGGLTVLKEITTKLPQYDYIYLGDNARAPYGSRSFETVYQYTWQNMQWFFNQGCNLVILACNTSSAKALRTIQQNDLPGANPEKRVLGVIRPTAEVIGNYSTTKHIGILGTPGTVQSHSYLIEIHKSFPDVKVHQKACPLWVSLIEHGEYKSDGADYYIKKYIDELMAQSSQIDTILLGCTHYPLILDKIRRYTPSNVQIISQGRIVADSLGDYLHRHPEMEAVCSKNSRLEFYTTDSTIEFDENAIAFFGRQVHSKAAFV